MNDFQKRFDKRSKDFDRDFERTGKFNLIVGIVGLITVLGSIVFLAWTIVMIMRFFGIV